MLEEHLRELELRKIQAEQELEFLAPSPAAHKRKSFRPVSAKPRTWTLTPLAEDVEVVPISFHGVNAHCFDNTGLPFVSEIFSSSFDEMYCPANVLESGTRTLWISSGMFPQFLQIVLREPKRVTAVEVTCRFVSKLQLRASCNRNVAINQMTLFGDVEVGAAECEKLDTHRFPLGCCAFEEAKVINGDDRAKSAALVEAIQIDIESRYSDFVCVYFVRLHIDEFT